MTTAPAVPEGATPANAPRRAYVAVILANIALAFGPWFVRLADTGPVASAFWRITLAAPLLVAMALATGWRPAGLARGLWATLAVAGVAFAADLASWHLGILQTTLANATLFGNSAILIFPLYGFIATRSLPSRVQGLALALASVGAALLMGQSYQLDPRHLGGDLLCLLAGVLYALYFILMARARSTMPPLPALTLSTLASIAPLLLFATALGERIVPTHWGALIGLALASQVFGQGL
ncbi:MAG: EamA family transporter, partial [Sphingobium sp.]|nr:EamA family transporter [Sphingobium sp.]